MDEEERGRIARRVAEIERELHLLSAENTRRVKEDEPLLGMHHTIGDLAKAGGEVTPAMLSRLRTHFQIIATELLTRQEQCERLANEAAEAAELIARLESDR
jgi:hypothetical protein